MPAENSAIAIVVPGFPGAGASDSDELLGLVATSLILHSSPLLPQIGVYSPS